MFVVTKRTRSILYPISTNTQWGLIPFFMSKCRHICSSLDDSSRKNFPLVILSAFMTFSNVFVFYTEYMIKNIDIYGKAKVDIMKRIARLLRFHIKVKYST